MEYILVRRESPREVSTQGTFVPMTMAATHFGGAELAAMVMGTKVPCVLTSRGDSRLTKMYSIALACLAAR